MRRGRLLPYILIAPALALLAVFKFYPVAKAFYLSVLRYDLTEVMLTGPVFVGLSNFKEILVGEGSGRFWNALRNSLLWVGGSVGTQFFIGLAMALVLHQRFKGRGFFRAMVLCPWAISGVIISFIWGWMLHGQVGIINDLLIKLHLIRQPIAWLASPTTAMISVIMANSWKGSAFFAVTLLAALQSIPEELYEAAGMDGAGRLGRFRYITVPMIRDMIVLTTALRAIWTFNAVDLIYVMTGGGPVNATETLAVHIFMSFLRSLRLGYGSALAVVLFFILMVFTVVYFRMTKFGEAR
jgi:multiple sugar transport system permease protein